MNDPTSDVFIHMYADDTVIYALGRNTFQVAGILTEAEDQIDQSSLKLCTWNSRKDFL